MEVFSLLKYWRTNNGATDANLRTNTTAISTTTIRHVAEAKEVDDNDDDGPFFDLEFTVPPEVEEEEQDCDVSDSEVEDDEEQEGEFDFTVDSSVSTGNLTDPNVLLSPSDDLFFNGRFVPLEPSELSFSPNESHSSKLQFPGALLKPATKLRVLMLGFKKPKCAEKLETKHQLQSKSSFTVKLKIEEVPIVSLFSRDSSSRNNSSNKIKQEEATAAAGGISICSEDKKYGKDVLQKYLKMVKPLYFRVSRKSGDKSSTSPSPSPSPGTGAGAGAGGARLFSGQLSLSPISSPTKSEIKESEVHNSCVKLQKEGNLTAGLRNVRKHLGKSRSASSAVAAAPSMAAQSRRHDDSLLQQQDGIQSAILHCKRSFTASRDSDDISSSSSSSGLSRSTSENLCRES